MSFYRFFVFTALLFGGSFAFGQYQISGYITDEQGRPLPGANVSVLGTARGAVADTAGFYAFKELQEGGFTLQVSFIGFETLQKQVMLNTKHSQITANFELPFQSIAIADLLITATRAGGTTPMTYANIGKDELQRGDVGQDLPYLLQWTPSVVVTSDAGTGVGYTGLRIRGSDATRINVTVNGVPLNDAESQSVYWVNLPDFAGSTQDVQIQRGAGTSTNGAGAFGASINLSTAALREKPYASIQTSAGSFNTFKRNMQLGSGLLNKHWAFDARLSRITSDGFIDRAAASLNSYFLSGLYIGSKSSLRLNVFSGHEVTYQAWYGVPANFVDDPALRTYNPAGTEKPGDPYDNEVDNYRQTHYQLLYNTEWSPQWSANLTLHYTKGAGYYEQYKAGEYLADYGISPLVIGNSQVEFTDLIRRRWLDNHFYGAIYALRYFSHNQRLELMLGGGLNQYQGHHFGEVIWARFAAESELGQRYYDNDALKQDWNVFFKTNYLLARGLHAYFDLQYRRVGYHFLGINAQGQQVDQTARLPFFNPKIGLMHQWGIGQEAYGSFAVAQREPNRNDYTENTLTSRPRPERLYNTEVGYKRQWTAATLGLNVFHMYYRDQLAINGQLNDVGEYRRVNIEKSYRLGLEMVGGLQISPRWQANANASLSRNKIAAFTEYVDVYDADGNWSAQQAVERRGVDLAFSPAITAAFETRFQWLKTAEHQSDIALLGKYVGRQYLDSSGEASTALKPYGYLDLRLQHKWQRSRGGEFGFTFMAQNLLNHQYESNGWIYRYISADENYVDKGLYPQAGINFWVGFTVSWQ